MIKGIKSIKFLESILEKGIRSKEFFAEGDLLSDNTPLDTDFWEISESDSGKIGCEAKIIFNTSVSHFGKTLIVLGKNDYEGRHRSHPETGTRFIETSIGGTHIKKVFTKEWDEEYAYKMACVGYYVPVFDPESEELLFSPEQYREIRDRMRGMHFYRADDIVVDSNVSNSIILSQAEELKKKAEKLIPTEEKRKNILDVVNESLTKTVLTDMAGDISKENIEFIDIGSTGRGTNIPGEGDFDFMLKCSSQVEQMAIIKILKCVFPGNIIAGENDYNIRREDVSIEGLNEHVDIDVTSEMKSLNKEYSSDMAVRDRFQNISVNYGSKKCQEVIDNIIVAKKKLNEAGLYKRIGSKDATKFGGFGGIGVENWILQNGGSFILAMQTFLDNTYDEQGNEVSFDEFIRKYPIYDFGQNHRDFKQGKDNQVDRDGHFHFIEGMTLDGFCEMKIQFRELLKEYGIEYEFKPEGHSIEPVEKKMFLDKSIKRMTLDAHGYKISDLSRIYGYVARLKSYEQEKNYEARV